MFHVKQDIQERLDIYHALVLKWQKAINLVAPSTLNDLKTRHFDDSLQMAALIGGQSKILYDLGSGAGFPGAVIAIAKPELQVTLIESDQRKCEFLKTVSRETGVHFNVLSRRIESDYVQELPPPDCVSARALAPLSRLLQWVEPWFQVNPDMEALFPKGDQYAEEIREAENFYAFQSKTVVSETSPDSRILKIRAVKPL